MLNDANNKNVTKFRSSPIIRKLETEGCLKEIEAALQGSVYATVRNHKGDGFKFAFRDLFGGPNWEWSDTPLFPIWENCLATKKGNVDAAYQYTARIAGFILKNVLIKDRRTFKQHSGFGTQCYSWVNGD